MEILIKDKAIVTILEEIADAFRALCPHDYEDFIRYVKEESKSLIKPSGMSVGGSLMNFMKIPMGTNSKGERVSLYSFIRQQMRKRANIDDFFRDRENYYLLCQVWQDAAISRRPTTQLTVKEDYAAS